MCGSCWFCEHELYSLCDNTNPNAELQEPLLGYPTAGIYAYTHALGGYAGAHAQYVRVPFADNDCFHVPEGLPDEQALFLSDAAPTGYMGADFCNIQRGDVIAVWGRGGVGLMAQQSAFLMGAERVIAIDRFPERLRMAREQVGAELNPSYLATHRFSLEEAPRGYEMFKNKEDGCVRAVFVP